MSVDVAIVATAQRQVGALTDETEVTITALEDAEILLAVDPEHRRAGVGTFILNQLEKEAATRGLNYLYNVVRPEHPDREGITAWLGKRGFARSHDDETLRRPVHPGK